MEIRFAQQKDIPRLIALLDQVGEVHHRIRPDIFPSGTRKYDEAALATLLQDENRPIFVAEADAIVLGYCFCVLKAHQSGSASTQRLELYIDDLCVEESCRSLGVGTGLYGHACAYAKSLGCSHVTLNVWCGNHRAMAFYEKLGLRSRSIMMEMPLED